MIVLEPSIVEDKVDPVDSPSSETSVVDKTLFADIINMNKEKKRELLTITGLEDVES